MTFLDATYKTSHFALPLFFLAVKTNVGYSVVGEFIVQAETKEAIVRGLQTISQWMAADGMKWEPRAFSGSITEEQLSKNG